MKIFVEVDNQYDILYDERLKINKRRSYSESIYPIAALAPPAYRPTEKVPVNFYIKFDTESKTKFEQKRRKEKKGSTRLIYFFLN